MRRQISAPGGVPGYCPALGEGCPHALTDGLTKWLDTRRGNLRDCPAFVLHIVEHRCPFRRDLPDSHIAFDEERPQPVHDPPLKTAVGAEVVPGGLAKLLKSGTAEAHARAERTHFVREFMKGRVPQEVYQQFVVNLHHVYEALEEGLDACWDNEFLEPLYFPDELRRTPALRRDAAFFLGEAWEGCSAPSAAALEYAQRLREVAQTAPELLVAHAYTRYLGDLSGGQLLARAAHRGMNLPDDGSGVEFYEFGRIPDTKQFKHKYRALLDGLPASKATANRLVDEANAAFGFNQRLFEELDVLLGLEGQPLPTPAPRPKRQSAPAVPCPFAGMGLPLPAGHPTLPPQPKAPPPPAMQPPRLLMLLIALAFVARLAAPWLLVVGTTDGGPLVASDPKARDWSCRRRHVASNGSVPLGTEEPFWSYASNRLSPFAVERPFWV